jgi:hypothetical protein
LTDPNYVDDNEDAFDISEVHGRVRARVRFRVRAMVRVG